MTNNIQRCTFRKHLFLRNQSWTIARISLTCCCLLSLTTNPVIAEHQCIHCLDNRDPVGCTLTCVNTGKLTNHGPLYDVSKAKSEEAAANLTTEDILMVQRALNQIYASGTQLAVDGVMGPATRKMIRTWEYRSRQVRRNPTLATGHLTRGKILRILTDAKL